MKTTKGIPTNGIYQFFRYFLDAVNKFEPSHIICCWDMGSKTFRTELYEDYKGNRSAPPEELVPQFDLVKEAVDAFQVPNIGLVNYEADDCIGTLANLYQTDHDVMILTGDQDILQLVDEHISVAIMKKGMGNYDIFNQDNFYEKKGIHPKQIIDLKGLMGDSADNYPGVKGIGEKTALKLLEEYESIENILANLSALPKGTRTKINENMDMLHMSRKLAEIQCDIPISCSIETAVWSYDREKVENAFRELEFKDMEKML